MTFESEGKEFRERGVGGKEQKTQTKTIRTEVRGRKLFNVK